MLSYFALPLFNEKHKHEKYEFLNFSLHESPDQAKDFHVNIMTFLKERFIKSIHISNQSQSALLRLFIFSSVHHFSQDAGKVIYPKSHHL